MTVLPQKNLKTQVKGVPLITVKDRGTEMYMRAALQVYTEESLQQLL